jgi:hypothetical protein
MSNRQLGKLFDQPSESVNQDIDTLPEIQTTCVNDIKPIGWQTQLLPRFYLRDGAENFWVYAVGDDEDGEA